MPVIWAWTLAQTVTQKSFVASAASAKAQAGTHAAAVRQMHGSYTEKE